MTDSIEKENQLHLSCVDLIVVIKVLLQDPTQLLNERRYDLDVELAHVHRQSAYESYDAIFVGIQ